MAGAPCAPSAASSSSAAAPPKADAPPEGLGDPIGDPPHIPVVLTPTATNTQFPTSRFAGQLSRTAPVRALLARLCAALGVPEDGLTLVHEGRELDNSMTLQENSVTLPGPAARRAGRGAELLFDVVTEVMQREERLKEQSQREAEANAEKRRRESQLLEKRESDRVQREREAEDQKKKEEWLKSTDPDTELLRYVSQHIGMFPQDIEAAAASDDPAFVRPPNWLEECNDEIRAAIEKLMNETGQRSSGFEVVAVYRNVHPVLRERYEKLKVEVGKATVKERGAATTGCIVKGGKKYRCLTENLGPLDPKINEYALWHGTPTPDGAGGICKVGFDIAFAGTATGSAYSPGFYFADAPGTSHGYAKYPWRVNDKYRSMHVMLLCRVVCGNLLEVASAPSEAEKETLTSQCFGPGGSFGAQSAYHSILGGGWAHVCVHRDQVYPEYVMVYQTCT